ncbi:hypothetical protein [Deinococcus soli (ex Cha et al. 2016)]|uniref:Uncharacterized protein n=2 Tax=Deinococcus soli (ex Cha et al. 2016) TaxID=1309411 RepID=A0AAE4BMJ2_9DEIO|nr:hypothetical protein [Deinococcus soli (ex Cha et al. 2016)]MDR6218209.1 hypothetical protein [Deinococcus soli (ex Cha et al. 2016)]MDR6328949.1 hypothetical protein [Deinococcus soli (ex Cha et al. 2016)]MDR6751222.1 hypothetical protein [Deinococcus soli (ex Cha et al. 2016)]
MRRPPARVVLLRQALSALDPRFQLSSNGDGTHTLLVGGVKAGYVRISAQRRPEARLYVAKHTGGATFATFDQGGWTCDDPAALREGLLTLGHARFRAEFVSVLKAVADTHGWENTWFEPSSVRWYGLAGTYRGLPAAVKPAAWGVRLDVLCAGTWQTLARLDREGLTVAHPRDWTAPGRAART